MSTSVILASAFVLSFVALLVFIWSQRHGLFSRNSSGANVIFGANEIGRAEEPALTSAAAHVLQQQMNRATGKIAVPANDAGLRARAAADESTTPVVFFMFCAAFAWLLVATAAGLLASYKLHEPDSLTQFAWLTFGRARAHR